MKKLIDFFTSRLVLVSLSLLLQLVFLLLIVLRVSVAHIYLYLGMQLLSLVTVFWIIAKRDNPSYKIAWIVPIMAMPLFGSILYLVFGNTVTGIKRDRRLRRYAYEIREKERQVIGTDIADLSALPPHLKRQANYVTRVAGHPVWKNTQVEYFPRGEDFWQGLLRELRQAEKFIFLEYFIVEEGEMWDPILEVLTQKAKAGVDVRLMFDDLGCIRTLPPRYEKKLKEADIRCRVFNPFRPRLNSMFNYRDHRKITVIDGDVAFCGGINLADEYINRKPRFGHWKDTAVLLRGDAAWNLTSLFLQMWGWWEKKLPDYEKFRPSGKIYGDDGFVQPYGDSPVDGVNIAENIYLQIINNAKRYVYITTPYLILDNEMITALTVAAESGVDVRIITPHIPDKWYVHAVSRSYYRQLIDSGVRIYEYTPGFIHGKMFVADDEVATVGTVNMDYRSFYLHYECGVVLYQNSAIRKVREDILRTVDVSEAVHPKADERLSVLRRIGRAFLRAFAPLM